MIRYFFIGNNSFDTHKRGVENVIEQQMKVIDGSMIFYIHWGNSKKIIVKKRNHFIDISLPQNIIKSIIYSILIFIKYFQNKKFIVSHNYLLSIFIPSRVDLFTVHDGLYYQNSRKNRPKLLLGLFWFIEKLVYFKSKKIHFVSNYSRDNSLFNGENSVVIYNNCRFESLEFDHISVTDFNFESYNLVVRSIEDRANLEVILNCAEINPNENFVICGKGPLLNYYIELSSKLSNIFFLGFVEDSLLVQLYRNCKTVIVPAKYAEGFGLPVIEGYFFNKIVFASRVGALPEVIYSEEYTFDTATELSHKLSNQIKYFNPNSFYHTKYSNDIIINQYQKLLK